MKSSFSQGCSSPCTSPDMMSAHTGPQPCRTVIMKNSSELARVTVGASVLKALVCRSGSR
eukprot:7260821-Pyramimonas_sp.AAC.1